MLRYYIADLHLDSKRPDVIRAFDVFLQEKAPLADELYLLGDIFEAWIGDDAIPDFLHPIFARLRALSQSGVRVFFQHGNRDFLVGQRLAEQLGVTLLDSLHRITTVHGKTVLMHGDQLCTDDVDYQKFRALVRSHEWQQQFLAKSVAERLEVACQLRAASREQGAQKAAEITDVTPTAVSHLAQSEQADLIIHGHTHRPCIHPNPPPASGNRIVLGDWDSHGWYLEQDTNGSRLYAFSLPVEDRLTATELRHSLAKPH
ncbi:UDP-2,3-diacylglucosamine diphosphatase [Marinobacterium marinum]|uniref:UDP-2,3-diacylglucosamine hydrolase n=1 Tax=Marinobacterium marinum TaxID=2756129 RepID=A0A7W1WXQ5_9GAMM|nr:UDP-2,3-diacylglucosamine diphosphatase [Marinobacterium marinum]MBA4502158.1 UDP-2,3-diacylglucosamine diphosphatase [Marinobacterium marinum]